jgi:hypothetical protein
MEDQPVTWRDVLGAIIIGVLMGALFAAFV